MSSINVDMTYDKFDARMQAIEDAELLAFTTREMQSLFACFDQNMSKAEKRNPNFECPLSRKYSNMTPLFRKNVEIALKKELAINGYHTAADLRSLSEEDKKREMGVRLDWNSGGYNNVIFAKLFE